MIRVCVFFKGRGVLPGFVKEEYRRIYIVLVQIVLNATTLFPRRHDELDHFSFDGINEILLH